MKAIISEWEHEAASLTPPGFGVYVGSIYDRRGFCLIGCDGDILSVTSAPLHEGQDLYGCLGFTDAGAAHILELDERVGCRRATSIRFETATPSASLGTNRDRESGVAMRRVILLSVNARTWQSLAGRGSGG